MGPLNSKDIFIMRNIFKNLEWSAYSVTAHTGISNLGSVRMCAKPKNVVQLITCKQVILIVLLPNFSFFRRVLVPKRRCGISRGRKGQCTSGGSAAVPPPERLYS